MKRIFAFSVIVIFLLGMIGCGKPQGDNSDPQAQNKLSNELIYDWLTENGELMNGTTISYTKNHINGDALSVEATQDKEVKISFSTSLPNGLEVTCSMPLISDSVLSFNCKIVDDTNTGTEKWCELEKATFTASSPIELADFVCIYIDGKSADGYINYQGKSYREYFSKKESKVVREEIPQEKITVIESVGDNFGQLAQQSICNMLDCMSADLCPLWGIELSDLGYKRYFPAAIVETA